MHKRIRLGLISAAIYNWCAALTLFFHPWVLELYGLSPIPEHPIWISMLGGIIGAFGFGYWWAAKDLTTNLPIIKLGALGKIAAFIVVSISYFSKGDDLSMAMFFSTWIDMGFVAFFAYLIVFHGKSNQAQVRV